MLARRREYYTQFQLKILLVAELRKDLLDFINTYICLNQSIYPLPGTEKGEGAEQGGQFFGWRAEESDRACRYIPDGASSKDWSDHL